VTEASAVAVGGNPAPASIASQDALLASVFLTCAPTLRARFTARTRDASKADDLVGDAFLRLAVAIRSGRPPRDPSAWLHRVGINLMISQARRSATATNAFPKLVTRDHAPSPEDHAMRAEEQRALVDRVRTMPVPDRELLVLTAIGHPPAAIARASGRSREATRTRLCRARRRLRIDLEAAGISR
jgi:RNA polymerase sigma-70 factor (ECF subfamily)